MAAARRKAVHQKMAKALIRAVADLHPDVAAEGMSALAMTERNGLRRRALRAAQILLIRKALEAPPPASEVVADVPEPEPVIIEAPPPPKPVPKGVLKTISLDDVAKMLMASEPDPEVAVPPAEAAVEPEFVRSEWATEAEDAPGTGSGMPDLAAEFAALMAADDHATASPAPVEERIPALSLLAEPVPEPAAIGVAEVGALFAAMEQADPQYLPDQPASATHKPITIDLSAQFAAMASDEDDSPKG